MLPIYGLAGLGLGMGWDAEENVASALLSASVASLESHSMLTVLPPLRLGLAPYQTALSGTDPDTLHEVLHEQAEGIRRTGFKKLVFWSSHPWNAEIIDAISRDIRIRHNLQTFVIEMGGLGLSLHPRFPEDRARVQALAAFLTGRRPVTEETGEPVDQQFRPGNWTHLPPIPPLRGSPSPPEILAAAAERLSGLWREVFHRPHLDSAALPLPVSSPAADTPIAEPSPLAHETLSALSTPQIQRVAHADAPLVVIPIGAIEQHGPHLPVGVDTMIAQTAADGLKARLGEAIQVLPPIAYGKSNEHEDYPGTVGISARSLRRVIRGLIRNLYQLGFRQFAVLNTHGGNSSVLVYTLRELQNELGVRAGMLRLPTSDELSPQEKTWGFHAGEWETSVMLAIAPDTVAMDRAVCHYPAFLADAGELRPENASAIFSWRTRDIAPAGVMGDATKATATKGEGWLQFALDRLADDIRQLRSSG